MNTRTNLVLLMTLSAFASAQADGYSILAGIEQHVGLVLLIASMVIIVLMVLMILYLHNISEHLNWIRRIR